MTRRRRNPILRLTRTTPTNPPRVCSNPTMRSSQSTTRTWNWSFHTNSRNISLITDHHTTKPTYIARLRTWTAHSWTWKNPKPTNSNRKLWAWGTSQNIRKNHFCPKRPCETPRCLGTPWDIQGTQSIQGTHRNKCACDNFPQVSTGKPKNFPSTPRILLKTLNGPPRHPRYLEEQVHLWQYFTRYLRTTWSTLKALLDTPRHPQDTSKNPVNIFVSLLFILYFLLHK